MALKTPNSGEAILPWAREATREIHSLRPTGGNGIDVTRTNGGTTISLKGAAITYPDSSPPVVAGPLTEQELSSESLSNSFKTTYSIEKNKQNAFSLFGFSDISSKYEYSFNQLSSIEFVIRDLSTNFAVLSCPTVRYWNFLDALSAWAGERGDGDDGSNGQNALSVIPDSEIRDPVTFSIQHNLSNVNELELYKFHDNDYLTQLNLEEQGITHFLIRHKGTRVDSTGQTVSCNYLEYVSLSNLLDAVISAGAGNDVYLFSTQLTEDDRLRTFFPSTQHVAYINGNEVHQDANSQIVDGWNFFNDSDNAVYLNFYCDVNALDAGNTYFAESGKWSWDLETVVGGQAGPNKVLMFSEMIAERVSDGEGGYILKQYRKGSVELGMPLGDADAQILGQALGNIGVSRSIQQYQVLGDTGRHMALQLYNWDQLAYQGITTGVLLYTFTNRYPRSSLALPFKDGHSQGAVNASLEYLNFQEFASQCFADSYIPNPLSKSITADKAWITAQEDDIVAGGHRLYNFYIGSNGHCQKDAQNVITGRTVDYTYPIDDIQTVSAYSDIVIRKRGQGGNVPEVSYIPLSALPLSGGGGDDYPLDGEEADVGYSLDLNSEDEAEIYGFEDVNNHRTNTIHDRRHDFILRYQYSGNSRPEVQYAKLSAVESIISADFGLDEGYTGSFQFVLSSSYSTQTHKFINHLGSMTFENGILKFVNTDSGTQEVFTAVEEEL